MPINNRTEAAGNVKKQTQEIQQTERGVEEFPPHPPPPLYPTLHICAVLM